MVCRFNIGFFFVLDAQYGDVSALPHPYNMQMGDLEEPQTPTHPQAVGQMSFEDAIDGGQQQQRRIIREIIV